MASDPRQVRGDGTARGAAFMTEHGRDDDRGFGESVADPCSKDSRSRWPNAITRPGGTRRAV